MVNGEEASMCSEVLPSVGEGRGQVGEVGEVGEGAWREGRQGWGVAG